MSPKTTIKKIPVNVDNDNDDDDDDVNQKDNDDHNEDDDDHNDDVNDDGNDDVDNVLHRISSSLFLRLLVSASPIWPLDHWIC